MKMFKKISAVLLAVLIMYPSMTAQASEYPVPDKGKIVVNRDLNDEIGFVLYKASDSGTYNESLQLGLFSSKKYTEDSYNGYFYYKGSNEKISEHKFTAKFSYDGSIATCYDTSSSIVMVDNDTNLHPKAEDEGRNNLTPTQVYGYVTFILYNTDDTVNVETTVKIYCNQDGHTWVNRQG